ncbi:hypothetical protein [Nocardia crassostreae]|uniref:hypothetical protein n=1 Tax=Nocardia crassostreae TaxID=53428 RepID=UPI000ACD16F4|nr:hypothetical protein [Nocardia crassostreae]
MMGSPMAGSAAGRGGNGHGGSRGGQRFPRASAPVRGGAIYLRAHGGYGEFAVLDPDTGALSSAPSAGAVSGVYGDMDGTSISFYRDQAGLILRVGQQVIELDRMGAGAAWEPGGQFHWFAVYVGGNYLCELRYRPVEADADLGLLIRDVLADPLRRSGIFG